MIMVVLFKLKQFINNVTYVIQDIKLFKMNNKLYKIV